MDIATADIDVLLATQIAINQEIERRIVEGSKPKFPMDYDFYVYRNKEDNWNEGRKIGLSDVAAGTFAYEGLEICLESQVHEDGTVTVLGVNGTLLVTPVAL